jgi:hypothetical protein
MTISMHAAKLDAEAASLHMLSEANTPQVPICGYGGAWPMTEAEFRLWAQELKASVGGF